MTLKQTQEALTEHSDDFVDLFRRLHCKSLAYNLFAGKGDFLVRLFVYVPGEVLEGKPYSAKLCFQVGQLAGKLDTALKVRVYDLIC